MAKLPSVRSEPHEDAENDCRTINLDHTENKFWLEENSAAAKREMIAQIEAAKQKTEKERYIKALRALVDEKGQRGGDGKIPDLCSCGALRYNATQATKDDPNPQMCASNCQYYKNDKGYERALRDILHSISLFK
jgi:hypothetical protein